MPEIQVLPKELAELIAAGEVIERPASVLKELAENAIDAGAKHITAELKRGGILYLRVTDDGCGIAPDQVQTAFLRHATSKIHEKADLESIFTLGFRGEALASICAVSRTEVLTRQKGAPLGTHYAIEGGEQTAFEESGCPEGTTVVVRDLFYNVPVRAGFLKKDTAEGNAAASVFQKTALSHPEVSFRLIRENHTEFVTPGDGDLFSAIHAVFGRDFTRDMLPVQYTAGADGISVGGYITKPLYSKSTRSHQLFFVNGRPVRSFVLINAIEEAYQTLIMTGKYPVCVLRVQIPPRVVDVNMHPTKAEVRFSDEKTVYQAVYFAVMDALHKSHLVYEFQMPPRPDGETVSAPALQNPTPPKRDWFAPVQGTDSNTPAPLIPAQPVQEAPAPLPVPNIPAPAQEEPRHILETVIPPVQNTPVLQNIPTIRDTPPPQNPSPVPHTPPAPEPPAEPLRPKEKNAAVSAIQRESITAIGELFSNYILAQAGETFVMIDKHAAHERILFERFRRRECRDRQTLLTPVKLLLTADEADALQAHAAELESCGFSFSFEELPVVRLTGVPLSCADLDLDAAAAELAEACMQERADPSRHMLDDRFHDLACKAAIRAGDHNTREELQSLAEQVWGDERIRHCPHGRPVMFLLSRYQIEKQFQRIQH